MKFAHKRRMETIRRCVASHADIDVRRALGVYGPIRVPEGFTGRTLEPISFRWFPHKKMIVYLDFRPHMYELVMYKNVEMSEDVVMSCEVHKTWGDDGKYMHLCDYYDTPFAVPLNSMACIGA